MPKYVSGIGSGHYLTKFEELLLNAKLPDMKHLRLKTEPVKTGGPSFEGNEYNLPILTEKGRCKLVEKTAVLEGIELLRSVVVNRSDIRDDIVKKINEYSKIASQMIEPAELYYDDIEYDYDE